LKELQKIFKKRGMKALQIARREALQERITSPMAREALTYFMKEYWHDLARPSLMSMACEAVGGNPELTTPVAVPMILISGAFDIHDDIIDRSKRKDGRPTVYGKYGADIALLVGDALLFKGLTLLNDVQNRGISAEKTAQSHDIVKNMFFELGDAEALELDLRGRIDVSPEHYLAIVRMKAADVEAHTHISAILGDASKKEVKALSEYGRLLGMMIILRDDLIDLMVAEEFLNRIKRECLPLPLLYGLQDPNAKTRLESILRSKKRTHGDLEKIIGIINGSGAMDRYQKLMGALADEAISKSRVLKQKKRDLELLIGATLPPGESELRRKSMV